MAEENLDNLFENERVSIPLTPKNAVFKRSEGGLISLDLTVEEKNETGETIPKKEFFERIVIFRCFPVTNPNELLSVREPDSKKMGRGKEIGMIRYMKDFSEEEQILFLEELDRRYFSPEITKINSVKDKFGCMYWEVETNAGNMTFLINNPFSNIRLLEDGRIFINDIDGNSFQIKDPRKLDSNSFKKIEIYI
ncbi:MAG: DUF1854 domain-containing protein [Oscillospiraceae bacterium]|nr:DUF1854 domain-containing protein [Oscillospiraceae bacterium]